MNMVRATRPPSADQCRVMGTNTTPPTCQLCTFGRSDTQSPSNDCTADLVSASPNYMKFPCHSDPNAKSDHTDFIAANGNINFNPLVGVLIVRAERPYRPELWKYAGK